MDEDEPMIAWHEEHPVYGRGDECQACGCGFYSDVHINPVVTDSPRESNRWYCTACIYQELLRPAVLAFTRPTEHDYQGAATFYCDEHLDVPAPPLAFSPQAFLINIALHAARDGDDPDFEMFDVLLAGLEQVA